MGITFEDALSDPAEGRIVIISIITVPLCILTTILRLVATKRSGRKFGWDDAFAVLGLLGFLAYACTPFAGVGAAGDLDDEALAVLVAKLSYIASPFYYVNQLFVKGSLFVLYHRMFWSDRTFVRWVHIIAVLHVCWFITFFFFLLFLCKPISKWWDVSGTQPGYCVDGNAFMVPEETINSAIDFAMVVLTVAVIRKLQIKKHLRAKLAFIFIVGGFSGVIGFVKIGLVYGAADTNGQENDTNAFWDILQMAASILCACAPMYKSLLPVQNLWIRLKTSIASWASRSRLYRSVPSSKTDSAESSLDPRGYDGHSGGSETATNWPRFVGGSETQYTWSEFETDIQLPVRNPPENKAGQTYTSREMV